MLKACEDIKQATTKAYHNETQDGELDDEDKEAIDEGIKF